MKVPLDTLMRDWAARQQPSEAERRQLEARVLQRVRQTLQNARQGNGQPTYRKVPNHLRHPMFWFAAGIAATLMIAGIWHFLILPHDPLVSVLREENGLFAGRRRSIARIFCETERLFGPNLQWIAQSGNDDELGLAETPMGEEPLVVRIVIVARPVGNGAWRRLWETEVVARANARLELTPDGMLDNHLALWLYQLEGGAALVESRLRLNAPVAIEAETSEVLKFGATRKVTRVLHKGFEYLLLQTVAPVGENQSCAS